MTRVWPRFDSNLQELLGRMTAAMIAALGPDLVGLYLQGSLALGDFDAFSDVDFTAVTRHPLSTVQLARLQAMHSQLHALPGSWSKRLDGSYFPLDLWQDQSRCGAAVWYLDNGADALVRSAHCNTLVVRWIVREHGRKLFGPDPALLVDAVPTADLKREIIDVVQDWGAEILTNPERFNTQFYQGFIVLSYCRMLQSISTGIVTSKRQGAGWAAARLDSSWRSLVDAALQGRADPALASKINADPAAMAQTLSFVHAVMAAEGRVAEVGVRPQA